MIKLSSVSKTFGTTVALHETTLDVPTGDITMLIGPSGCGKSTILKLIIGLLEPTGGSIDIGGERVSPANILPFAAADRVRDSGRRTLRSFDSPTKCTAHGKASERAGGANGTPPTGTL